MERDRKTQKKAKSRRKRGVNRRKQQKKKTGSGLKEAEFFTRSYYRPIRVQKPNFSLLVASGSRFTE